MHSSAPLTRYARLDESPYLDRALALADPQRAALAVTNHMYHLVHYGDPVAEYWSLVQGVTLCDVAFQRQVEIRGPEAFRFVQHLVPLDLNTCAVGQCRYVFVLDAEGSVIADPVMLRLDQDRFWLSCSDADLLLWCRGLSYQRDLDVQISTPAVAPVQIQGPRSVDVITELFGSPARDLGYYRAAALSARNVAPGPLSEPLLVSRTGLTPERSYELYVPVDHALEWWDHLVALGARHDLSVVAPNHIRRIESGRLSHGCDITAQANPLDVDLGYRWLIDLDQPEDFVGKEALVRRAQTPPSSALIGVEIDGPSLGAFVDGSMPRAWPLLASGEVVGRVTSACESPRLESNIGYALVPAELRERGTNFEVVHHQHGSLQARAVERTHWKETDG
jgi:aminomethyltransferase